MSVKHVKKYYHDIEKMYLELVSELAEMKDDFAKGNCTEEELNNLLIPVKGIEENYKRLSYIMYLLFQPNRDEKEAKYKKQNKELNQYFIDNNIAKEKDLEIDRVGLETFKEKIKEIKNGSK